MPPAIARFVDQVCAVVVIVAGDTVRASAERLQVLDPPLTVQWKDVHEIYRNAAAAFESADCFDESRATALGLSTKKYIRLSPVALVNKTIYFIYLVPQSMCNLSVQSTRIVAINDLPATVRIIW